MARSDETTAENRPRRSDGTRQGWDRRYAAADRIHATPVPNRFLVSEISNLAPGTALDLACGAGRNAVWLADARVAVDADSRPVRVTTEPSP
jgi:SAM-dependent methyltransferase